MAKQHKTSHWESSAESHNNLESNIVQQVFANVKLWEVCTADLALLPSDCICTVHCGTFYPLHPRPHMTKTAVLPTTCPAKRECTARPGCSLVRRGVQHTKLIRPNSWIKQECFQLASPSNPPLHRTSGQKGGKSPSGKFPSTYWELEGSETPALLLAVQGKWWHLPYRGTH